MHILAFIPSFIPTQLSITNKPTPRNHESDPPWSRSDFFKSAGIFSVCDIGRENIVCARKTEREQRPDSKTRARKDFAWQHFELVDEKTAIAELAGFLHPSYVRQGGYSRKMAIESVRSAIKRARKNRFMRQRVSNNPNSLLVKDFLAWACNHWT